MFSIASSTDFPVRHVSLLLFTAFIIGFGCSANPRLSYDFLVQDGESKSSLGGVAITVSGYGHYHDNRLFPGKEEFQAGPTDTNGRAKVPNLLMDLGWDYMIILQKAGYRTLVIQGEPSRDDLKWWFFYKENGLDSDDFTSVEHRLFRQDVNTILMYKLPGPTSRSSTHP